MRKSPVLLVVVAALTGCAFQVDPETVPWRAPGARAPAHPGTHADKPDPTTSPETPAPPLPAWDASAPFTGLADGYIGGHVGPTAVESATDLASVYDDGYYAQIEVYALRSDGVRVMLQLQVENGFDGPFLQPGRAIRMVPGATKDGAQILGVGCSGPDSGAGDANDAFAYTDFDEEPCDTGVGTTQDPNDPQTLDVTLAATFADDQGNCDPLPGDNGDGTAPMPGAGDGSGGGAGDGSGGGCGADPTDPGATDPGATDPNGDAGNDPGSSDARHPLAIASFRLTR